MSKYIVLTSVKFFQEYRFIKNLSDQLRKYYLEGVKPAFPPDVLEKGWENIETFLTSYSTGTVQKTAASLNEHFQEISENKNPEKQETISFLGKTLDGVIDACKTYIRNEHLKKKLGNHSRIGRELDFEKEIIFAEDIIYDPLRKSGQSRRENEFLKDFQPLPYPASLSDDVFEALQIRAYLKKRYFVNTSEKLDYYLIIVGDINIVPSFYCSLKVKYPNYANPKTNIAYTMGQSIGMLTDYYYADLTSDYLTGDIDPPFLMVSRLPAENTEEVGKMLDVINQCTPPRDFKNFFIPSNTRVFDTGNLVQTNKYIDTAKAIKDEDISMDIWDTNEQPSINGIIAEGDYSTVGYIGDSFFDRWNPYFLTDGNGNPKAQKNIDGYDEGDVEKLNIKNPVPLVLSFTCANSQLDRTIANRGKSEKHNRILKIANMQLDLSSDSQTSPLPRYEKLIDEVLIKIFSGNGAVLKFKEICFGKYWLLQQKAASFLGTTRVPNMIFNTVFSLKLMKKLEEKKGWSIGAVINDTFKDILEECKAGKRNQNFYNLAIDHIKTYMLLGDPTIVLNI